MRHAPFWDASIRTGDVPPWIRRTRVDDHQVHVECAQCGAQHTALTGPQAVAWAVSHECWTLDRVTT